MRKIGPYILACLLLLLSNTSIKATHIVGGEMNYRCLGNNQYEIILTVYRDCANGVPAFDNPASVGIYNGNGSLFTSLNVSPSGDDTLSTDLADPCFVVPANACIHKTTYYAPVNLPFSQSGYKIVYQRCCRNNVIVNVTNPGNTGATFSIDITGEAQQVCNNSPYFKDLPNVYLCQGLPFTFDHSVIDLDGDSIRYELCTPFNGASSGSPIGHNPPPYSNIVWAPSYGVNQMLGPNDPLTIDSLTGVLTGSPNASGIFLVGVCAKEYRNGVLLSVTRRDFQYAIGACQAVAIAGYDDNFTPCEDLDFQFNNLSILNGGGYLWHFDTLGTSTVAEPNFVFPDTGIYNIMLVAGAGTLCPDTFASTVNVQIQAVDLSIAGPQLVCVGDTADFLVTNAYANYTGNTQYLWDPSAQVISGQGNDSASILINNNFTIHVYGSNNFGCEDSVQTMIFTISQQAIYDTLDLPCNNSLEVAFENPFSANPIISDYLWYFDTLGTSTATNPVYTFPDTGKYDIMLLVGNSSTNCPDTFFIHLDLQLDGLDIPPLNIASVCTGDSLWVSVDNLLAAYSGNTQFTWSPNNQIVFGQGSDSVLLIPLSNFPLSVTILNSHGCQETVSGQVNALSVIADFDTVMTPCNTTLTIPFYNTSSTNSGNVNYLWVFDTLGTSNSISTFYNFQDQGTYSISLIAGVGTQCQDTMTMDFTVVLDGMDIQMPINIQMCAGDSLWLQGIDVLNPYRPSTQYTWSNNGGASFVNTTRDSVLVVPSANSTIKVVAQNSFGCIDSAQTNLIVLAVNADYRVDTVECNSSLKVTMINQSTSNPQNNNYRWFFDGLGTGTGTHQVFNFPDTGTYSVLLIAGFGSNCPDTIQKDIDIRIEGIGLEPIPDTAICYGDTIALQAVDSLAAYSSSIQWSWASDPAILNGQTNDLVLLAPTASTTLQVIALNNHNCADTMDVIVDVRQIAASFDSINTACNLSLTVPFQNNSLANVASTNYEWIFDTLGVSTLNDPTFTFPDTGLYQIQLIADAGLACPDTFVQVIDVQQRGIELAGQDVQTLCENDTVLLSAINLYENNSDYTLYDWQPNNLILSGQGTDSATAILSANTIFTVIGTNAFGCQDTLLLNGVFQNIAPVLTISAAPDSIFVGQTAQITATNDLNYTYNWLPDTTLSDAFIFDPEAKPRTSKTYYLLVQNQFGCWTRDSIQVSIKAPICDDPLVFVPNAFTPDGDGYNDILMVNGNEIEALTFAVYNRWGQLVFETQDQSMGWDGRFKGKALPPDIYGYYLKCTCSSGGSLLLKGNITLLR